MPGPRRLRGLPRDPGRERDAAAGDLPDRAHAHRRARRGARRRRRRLHRQAVRERGAGGARARRAAHEGGPRRARRAGRARRADRRLQPPRARRARRTRRSRWPCATAARSRACCSTSTTSSRSTTPTATPPATRCCARPRSGSATASRDLGHRRPLRRRGVRRAAARDRRRGGRRGRRQAARAAGRHARRGRARPASRSARASASPPGTTAMRTPSDLYAAADEALYRAKALGRDRTELHVPAAALPRVVGSGAVSARADTRRRARARARAADRPGAAARDRRAPRGRRLEPARLPHDRHAGGPRGGGVRRRRAARLRPERRRDRGGHGRRLALPGRLARGRRGPHRGVVDGRRAADAARGASRRRWSTPARPSRGAWTASTSPARSRSSTGSARRSRCATSRSSWACAARSASSRTARRARTSTSLPGVIGSFDGHWHDGRAADDPDRQGGRRGAAGRAPRARAHDARRRALPGHPRRQRGRLPGGRDRHGAPIVIGAHHDGWFRAAFDNASGVAAMLAIAAR